MVNEKVIEIWKRKAEAGEEWAINKLKQLKEEESASKWCGEIKDVQHNLPFAFPIICNNTDSVPQYQTNNKSRHTNIRIKTDNYTWLSQFNNISKKINELIEEERIRRKPETEMNI